MVADNRLAELAELDAGKLSDLMAELKLTDLDMELTGFGENELEQMLLEEYPDNATGESKNKPPEMIIRFQKPEDFKKIEDDIRELMDKKQVTVSISCGEV